MSFLDQGCFSPLIDNRDVGSHRDFAHDVKPEWPSLTSCSHAEATVYISRQHNPAPILATLALITASACTDQASSPTAPGRVAATAVARPAPAKLDGRNTVRITSLTINPTVLTIGGSGTQGTQVTWTATIENPKKQTLSNMYIQTRFVVYLPSGNISGWRAAGGGLIQCPGRSPGFVHNGTCTISGIATPSNDAGGGESPLLAV